MPPKSNASKTVKAAKAIAASSIASGQTSIKDFTAAIKEAMAKQAEEKAGSD